MSQKKKATILLVDDEAANLGVLFEHLRQANYKVFIAKTAADALQQMGHIQPDLILIDIMLPDMDGFELCRRLKKNRQIDETPIIFLSALTDTADKIKGLDLGAVDYITKPFAPDEVVARVEKHLLLRHLHRELQEKNAQLKQEIVERKRAERKIQQQYQFLNNVIDSLPYPFHVINVNDYTIEIANSASRVLRITGRSTCHALTHQQDTSCNTPEYPCPLAQALKTKKAVVVEHIHFDQAGNPINVEIHGYPVLNDEGEVVQMIEHSLDITKRKQTEETLQQRNRELNLINQTGQIFSSSLNLDQVLQTVLQTMHHLLKITGASLWLLVPETGELICRHAIGPEHNKIIGWRLPPGQGLTGQVAQTGEPLISADIRTDPRHFKKVDQKIGLKIHSLLNLPLKVKGQVIGVLNLVDTSVGYFTTDDLRLLEPVATAAAIAIENARLFDAVQQARETATKMQYAAEAANQAKSAFLAQMSHELRTPLNVILGFSQVMTRSQSLPPEHQENLDIIHWNGEHLLTLINQVLALSKIETGRITLEETSFDLYHLLNDLEGMFRLQAEDKRLQLVFDRPPAVPQYVHADQAKLRQVLINLLGNAIKFTKEGRITLRVDKTAEVLKTSAVCVLHFEIEDAGPGIAPDELDTIFDAFTQTQTGRQTQEGTGLGLTISRRFAQLMGGDIQVESPPMREEQGGQGTIFKFDIQAGIVEATEVVSQTVEMSRQVVALEPGQPGHRILIVDDQRRNRQVMVKLLTDIGPPPNGFDLREAENGQEALEIWDEWDPHLIWMDMRMPVMDGYETARRIKTTTKGQTTTIIALTASAFEEERKVILSAGCDDFVRKPFREIEIFDIMGKYLGLRFVYKKIEIESRQTESDKVGPITDTGVQTLMATLPPDLLTNLEQAATRIDLKTINRLIDEIRPHHPALAAQLAALAKDFKFHEIVALIQQAQD